MPEWVADGYENHEKWMDFVLDAFFELSTCRPITATSVAMIPWTAIDQYASRHGFDGEDLTHFVEAIRKLDVAYFEDKKGKGLSDGKDSDDEDGEGKPRVVRLEDGGPKPSGRGGGREDRPRRRPRR